MLTEGQMKRIDRAVERVAREVGFGRVTIVIERGRARRLQQETDEWLERPSEASPPAGERTEVGTTK
jgi:hypothetical protein